MGGKWCNHIQGLGGQVQKANGLACFLTNVIHMIVPGKVIANPDTKQFTTATSFDGLVVHQELHVMIRILLGSNDHGFDLAGITEG